MKKFLSLLLMTALILCMPFSVALAEQPTVLTIGSVRTSDGDWFTYPVIERIKEKLNIELDYIQYDDDTFSLTLAGGDLPDIVVGNGNYVTTILNNKLALNIYPLLEKYAPNILSEQYAGSITIMQNMLDLAGDELYLLAPNTGVENAGGSTSPNRGYVIRWDYYKEIGCPEIKNDDDYIAAVKAMQALHPETEDGKRTYGFGVERSLGDMGGYRASFVSANYTNPWTFGSYKFKSDLVTSELYDGYMDVEHSSYWTDMAFYNKLYREGLFDVDSFTMTYDEWIAKVGNGIYMGLYIRDDELNRQASAEDPKTLKGYVLVPSTGAISFANKLALLGNFPNGYTFIPANSENWELALAFMNELYDPDNIREMYSGAEGEYWDYDESGKPYLFDEALELKAANELPWTNLSALNMFLPYSSTSSHPDGAYYDLFSLSEYRGRSLDSLQRDFCDYYGMTYPGEKQQALTDAGETIDMGNDRGQTISACISDIPLDIKRILDACNDILDRSMPTLIMAENDEAFEKVKQDVLKRLEAADEATAWTWALESWNAAREKVDPAWTAAKEAMNG